MSDNVQVALTKLGGNLGFKEVRSRNESGSIEIVIKFKPEEKKAICTCRLEIDEEHGHPIVVREILSYRRGTGFAVKNELANVTDETQFDREEHILKSKNIWNLKI